MKKFFKNILLFIVIAAFLFTLVFFKHREGVGRSEWITPGYHNKDRYYNEHKKSGNPEIDAIEYNHRAKKPIYIDSNTFPTIYDTNTNPPAPKPPVNRPIKPPVKPPINRPVNRPIKPPINRPVNRPIKPPVKPPAPVRAFIPIKPPVKRPI